MADTPLTPPEQRLKKPPGYNQQKQGRLPPRGRGHALPPKFYHDNHKRRRRNCCRSGCCICCIILVLIIFLLAVAATIFYIWYNPKLPQISLQSIKIAKYDIVVKRDGTYMNVQVVANVEANNPNKYLGVFYGPTHAMVRIEDHDIGGPNLKGFEQKPSNRTTLKVESRGSVLVNDNEGKKLMEKYKKEDLKVETNVNTGFGMIVQGLKMGPIGVDAHCGGVSMQKIESNAPQCKFTILRWIHLN